MKRICSFLAVISLGLLAGCAAMFGENLPSTTVDSSFDKRIMRFSTSMGTPETVAFYLKSYNQSGMIAVCGVAILSGRGVLDQLVDLWLNEAFVALRNNSNRIVSARFIGQAEEKNRSKIANCVKTTTPATPELLNARVRLTGGSITYQ